ncbi:hypothetical protein [Sodalis glossinidius]|uniref:hypothetical protein n=1 Tax=Sodalis glossinidius TaxID=63612 RepID=UPI0006832832|nr:hypothetical protein [Sodalis glossinidius]
MNKRIANSPDLVRKRSGTKAFEYHIDCLPEQAREIIKQRHYKSLIAQAPAQPVDESVKGSTAIKSRDELAIMRQCPALWPDGTGSLPRISGGLAGQIP